MDLTGSPSLAARIVDNPLPRGWATVAIATTLLLIFWLDLVTGSAPVQHLYYLPIIFAAVRFGNRGGLAAAAMAIVFYHLDNSGDLVTFHYHESDVVQIAVFIAVGVIAAKLAKDTRLLHRLAMTDDLTGLHNLRSFEARLRHMVRTARATETPLSLLVLDVDRLKSLNDAHGHLAGAEAVRTVGQVLAAHIPWGSAACRYGGDEFVVGLPRSGQAEARRVAEELNRAVNALAPVLAGVAFPRATLSISVGVASRTFDPPHDGGVPFEDDAAGVALFRAADAALYAAKNDGRNRVATA